MTADEVWLCLFRGRMDRLMLLALFERQPIGPDRLERAQAEMARLLTPRG